MKAFDHSSGNYIISEKAKIYYAESGEAGKPPLVLLHGGFGNMEDWNILLPYLKKDFHVIGIDSRGHGKSTMGDAKLSYELIQLDVETVLKSLGIDEVSMIGFSDGGIVAYRMAVSGSIQIDKLVTIGSRWHASDAQITREIFVKITPESWKQKFPDTYASYQRLNPEADFNRLVSSVINMWLDEGSSGHPGEMVSNIDCPTLIIRGDNDHLLSQNSAVAVAGQIKGSALLNLPFAGHAVLQDQTQIVTDIINQFFDQ